MDEFLMPRGWLQVLASSPGFDSGTEQLSTNRVSGPRLKASADPLQPLGVLLRALDVDVGAARDHRDGLFIERADSARRRTDDQRIVGKGLTLGNQRAGADQRILADL